ncbi:type II secretion system protein [Paraburkholderia heleia]|uniref:type II secretion system protein n=1 Tax=Paraburkholderia heleia TaxID=634127 RepID=UPI002AB7E64E|nr:prepilin-type N-terminal cleavage/methylation domain-containing protein [Paraburkholderia heleia]
MRSQGCRQGYRRGAVSARSRQSGFSLVEMAVVLIVIGLIVASVVVGKDAVRDAEYGKLKKTLVEQWKIVYDTYVTRTGVPIGDDPNQPRYMVNGAEFAGNGDYISGGDMSQAQYPPAICEQNVQPIGASTCDGSAGRDLFTLIRAQGIEPPKTNAGEGHNAEYVYIGPRTGVMQRAMVDFVSLGPNTPWGTGNCMEISGLTPDLFSYLAKSIDGTPDANSGPFRQKGVATGNTGLEASGVSVNDTSAYGQSLPADTYVSGNREAQEPTVTGVYCMAQ